MHAGDPRTFQFGDSGLFELLTLEHIKPYLKTLLWTLAPGFFMGTFWVLGAPEYGHKSISHSWDNMLSMGIGFSLLLAAPSLTVCAFLNRKSIKDFFKLVTAIFSCAYLTGSILFLIPVGDPPRSNILGSLILLCCAVGSLGGVWIVRKFFTPPEPEE